MICGSAPFRVLAILDNYRWQLFGTRLISSGKLTGKRVRPKQIWLHKVTTGQFGEAEKCIVLTT